MPSGALQGAVVIVRRCAARLQQPRDAHAQQVVVDCFQIDSRSSSSKPQQRYIIIIELGRAGLRTQERQGCECITCRHDPRNARCCSYPISNHVITKLIQLPDSILMIASLRMKLTNQRLDLDRRAIGASFFRHGQLQHAHAISLCRRDNARPPST